MNKIILIFILLFSNTVSGSNHYQNEIGVVIGIPDMINVKYQHYFNKTYLGINTGFNPSKTIFIPGIYLGYKIKEINKLKLTLEITSAYWPKMEELISNSIENNIIRDWFHFALRPAIQYDVKRIRIIGSIGLDLKAIIMKTTRDSKWEKTEYLPSCSIGTAYLF